MTPIINNTPPIQQPNCHPENHQVPKKPSFTIREAMNYDVDKKTDSPGEKKIPNRTLEKI
jgi:hypothetical protein